MSVWIRIRDSARFAESTDQAPRRRANSGSRVHRTRHRLYV